MTRVQLAIALQRHAAAKKRYALAFVHIDGGRSNFCTRAAGYSCSCNFGLRTLTARPCACMHAACPAGWYCPDAASLIACPAGSYCPAESVAPQPCPAGNYCVTPATVATCPSGSYCPQNTTAPRACPTGCCPSPATLALVPCLAGRFCTENCTVDAPCPVGFFCPASSSAPVPCPAGSFNPSASTGAQSACLTCPRGSYCARNSSAPVATCSLPCGHLPASAKHVGRSGVLALLNRSLLPRQFFAANAVPSRVVQRRCKRHVLGCVPRLPYRRLLPTQRVAPRTVPGRFVQPGIQQHRRQRLR
jgi:hypothetical protein